MFHLNLALTERGRDPLSRLTSKSDSFGNVIQSSLSDSLMFASSSAETSSAKEYSTLSIANCTLVETTTSK